MTDPPLRDKESGGIPQRFPHIPCRVAQLPVRLFVAEPPVSRQGVEGIPRIERRLPEDFVIGFGQRRRPFGEPQRQHRFDLLAPGHVMQRVEELPHAVKPVGQDVALPFPPFVGSSQDTGSHIPHIDKIVATFDTGGQPAVQVIGNELGEMPVAVIPRSQDA